jgi:cell division protein FtsB
MTAHHFAIALLGLVLGSSFGWYVACVLTQRSIADDITDLEAQADALDRSRRQLDRDADLLHEAKKAHFDRVAASIVRQVEREATPWAHPAARRGWLQ